MSWFAISLSRSLIEIIKEGKLIKSVLYVIVEHVARHDNLNGSHEF